MNYDVDYFIAKYEAIPEDKFSSCLLHEENGKSCAVGHTGYSFFGKQHSTEESDALIKVLEDLPVTLKRSGDLVYVFPGRFPHKASRINDGETKEYTQKTPKQRIVAALRDAKALQDVRIEELEFENA